jgi:hypothetical protein
MSVLVHRALTAPTAVFAGAPLAVSVLLGLAVWRARHPEGARR